MSSPAIAAVTSLMRRHAEVTERTEFRLLGQTWDLLPGVYAPTLTHSAALYAEWVPYPLDGSFCELGCGTGYIAVTAAQRGCARVTASDVSSDAVANTRLNAERHGVADRVEILCGDMFAPFADGDRYDIIFWNSNFVETPERAVSDSMLGRAFFDAGYAAHDAFLRHARDHLAPGGQLLLGFTDLGNEERLAQLARRHGWSWHVARGVSLDAPEGRIRYNLIALLPGRATGTA
jgi:release factor glutamine methyltransferase